jgi:hypothetical protein
MKKINRKRNEKTKNEKNNLKHKIQKFQQLKKFMGLMITHQKIL